jgi:Alcohol dehydrogenase, class IV
MEIKHFSFSANFNQKLICGEKSILSLPSIVSDIGNKVLLVTTNSFTLNPLYKEILSNFQRKKIKVFEIINSGEPSVDFVDYVVENYSSENINVVVAIGGGSAIDTAKAISAMLPLKESVMFYLEGVGNKRHPGIKVPFIAIPTTAGTGAEATKNAVISRIGKDGFKKSLRHENFIPDIAILDPTLIKSCPPHVRVASEWMH